MTRRRGRAFWLTIAGGVVLSTAVGGVSLGVHRSLPLGQIDSLPDLGAMLRGPAFRLARVEFLGVRVLAPQRLAQLARLEAGHPLIDVDVDRICAALTAHPRVAECAAVRIPPDRIVVDLREREPIARLIPGGQGIDAEGARFGLQAGEGLELPVVEGDVTLALPLVIAARAASLALEDVRSTADGLVFRPAGLGVRVRSKGSAPDAVARWLRIVESGLVRDRGAREVDLRFEGTAVLRDLESKSKGGSKDGST